MISASTPISESLSLVDAARAALSARRPLSADVVARLRDELALLHSYDSNAIEGSTLTLRETVLVIKEGVTIAG